MYIRDDRDGIQAHTLSILIGGKDRVMSGWGLVPNGISYAYWACTEEHAEHVQDWVESRSDIAKVSQRDEPPQGTAHDHCHIYCVTPGHPALQGI